MGMSKTGGRMKNNKTYYGDIKLSLNKDQLELLQKLVADPNKRKILHAPTNTGKTRIALSYGFEQGTPMLYVVKTYNAPKEIIADMEAMGIRDKVVIVCSEGKNRIGKYVCRQNCNNCTRHKRGRMPKLNKKDFIGEVITPEIIAKKHPDRCPYRRQQAYEKLADILIVHQAYFEKNVDKIAKRLNGGTVIVDEFDELFAPKEFLIARYKLNKEHLESFDNDGGKLNKVRGALASTAKATKNPYTKTILWNLYYMVARNWDTMFCENPGEMEKNLLDNRMDILYQVLPYHIGEDMEKKLVADALLTKAEIERRVEDANKHVDKWRKIAKMVDVKRDLAPAYNNGGMAAVDFVETLQTLDRFEMHSEARSPTLNYRGGYLEIWMFGNNANGWGNKFDNILLVSATPANHPSLKSYSVIKLENIAKVDKNRIYLVESEKQIKELLQKYNLLGITTSKQRAEEVKGKYGGLILGVDITRDELKERVKYEKGLFIIDYYGSKTSKSVNELGYLDGAIVFHYIGRNPAGENDKDKLKEEEAKKLYQHIGRVFRTNEGEYRSRFVIISAKDKEAYNMLKEEIVPNWSYEDLSGEEEIMDRIEVHAAPLPVNPLPASYETTATVMQRYDAPYVPIIKLPEDFKPGDVVTLTIKKD